MSKWKFLKRNRKTPSFPYPRRGQEEMNLVRENNYGDYYNLEEDLEPGVLGVEETFPVPSLATRDSIGKIHAPPKPHYLQGLTICFTGKMARTREQMNALTYEYGMIPCSAVHSGVDLLIIADCNVEQPASKWSTKRNMARRLHVKTMSERLFFSNIRNPTDPPITRR